MEVYMAHEWTGQVGREGTKVHKDKVNKASYSSLMASRAAGRSLSVPTAKGRGKGKGLGVFFSKSSTPASQTNSNSNTVPGQSSKLSSKSGTTNNGLALGTNSGTNNKGGTSKPANSKGSGKP